MFATRGPVVLVLALAVAGAGASPFAQSSGTPPAGVVLDKAAREALDKTYKKHWQIAAVDPSASACRTGGGEPPAVVQADLNGDGKADLALAVKTDDAVHVVAILSRATDAMVVDVDSLGQSAATGYLGIEPRGTKFREPGMGLDDFFGADTLVVYRCGQPRTAYFWMGADFYKTALN